MLVKFSRTFSKHHDKAPKKIKAAFDRRLKLFMEDKFHSQLNNHPLSGRLKGYRSINITGDWRAIFREFNSGKSVLFEILGPHSRLYK